MPVKKEQTKIDALEDYLLKSKFYSKTPLGYTWHLLNSPYIFAMDYYAKTVSWNKIKFVAESWVDRSDMISEVSFEEVLETVAANIQEHLIFNIDLFR